MIDRVLPAQVATAEAFADEIDAQLYPEEQAAAAKMAENRRREYATGRMCARTALGKLGVPPGPIVAGANGAPKWPAGIVGSITHCAGYRAAAVARAADILAIGLDAEIHAPVPEDMIHLVAYGDEPAHLDELRADRPDIHWDRLLFCAKESLYKAWFPLTQAFLDFENQAITIDPGQGVFRSVLATDATDLSNLPTSFTGRWIVQSGLIITAVVVAA